MPSWRHKKRSDPLQLELNFNPNPPDQPLADLIPEAYALTEL